MDFSIGPYLQYAANSYLTSLMTDKVGYNELWLHLAPFHFALIILEDVMESFAPPPPHVVPQNYL